MIRTLLNSLQRWQRDECGTIAVQFAVMLIAVLVLAGAAVDFSRQETLSQELSASIDATAIAAARFAMDNSDEEAIKTYAKEFLSGSFKGGTLAKTDVIFAEGSITIDAQVELPTTILALASIDKFTVNATTTAEFVTSKSIEIALVLDTSESMRGDPLAALQDAANGMIDTIIVDNAEHTKMAIVPFNNFVNVGTDKEGQSWLSVPSDYSNTVTTMVTDTEAFEAMGCYAESYSCTIDNGPGTCWRDVCPGGADVPKKEDTVTYNFSWYGCVNSRAAPLDIEETNFHMTKTKGHMTTSSWSCNSPIVPLTSKISDLKDSINSLYVSAETYTAQGLAWGYRILTPEKPFTEAAPFSEFANGKGEKVIVLMSDGANTRMRDSSSKPTHWHADASGSNDQMIANCNTIKNANITIYTIAFGIADSTTKGLLKQCATSPSHAHEANSATDLKDAFEDVANDLIEIALTH